MDAASGNSTRDEKMSNREYKIRDNAIMGDMIDGKIDRNTMHERQAQLRKMYEGCVENVSTASKKVVAHVQDNKEKYQAGAVAVASVATLIGLAYCSSVGFNKNYGAKNTKIIEKALKQLPRDRLEKIIEKANMQTSSLTQRQNKALRMTINYLKCINRSLDVSDKFNAKRRQVILRFEVQLEKVVTSVDVDEIAANQARLELDEFGIDLDMDDSDIDNWFAEDDEPAPVVSQSAKASTVSVKPTVVKKEFCLKALNFTYPVPEKHVQYLYNHEQIELYKSCMIAAHKKYRLSSKVTEIPLHSLAGFKECVMEKLPDRFWTSKA